MQEDRALERLQAILSQPEFQSEESTTWWDGLVGIVVEPLEAAWAWLWQTVGSAASGREGWLGVAMIAVSLVLLVAAATYLLRSIRLSVRGEARLQAEASAERRERSDRLWQQAQALAAAGQWAEASRAAYLSALYALDEHAVLRIQSGLTNYEHAARLSREHPELGGAFAELVRRYDRVRYGHYQVTPEAFSELSSLVQKARATPSGAVAA
jgi:Domain of unknown function (DUF4129)